MPANTTWILAILVVGNFFATTGDVFLKLFGNGQSTFQYLFLRQLLLIILILPFWLRLASSDRHPGSIKVHFFRAVISLIGGGATLFALIHLPLSSANVIFYIGPLITIFIAALLFGEQLLFRRILVTMLGFSGVIIAIQPEEMNWGALAALITAVAVSFFNLSVRWLPGKINATNTVFWTTLCTLPMSLVLALMNWQEINKELIILVAGTCVSYWIYHISCTYAYRNANAGKIVVAEYSGLPLAFVFGWIMFSEKITILNITGMAVIFIALTIQGTLEARKPRVLPSSQQKD